MSIAERVTAHLPYFRRFARSVTGSQKSGDAYVVSTLEAILADPSIFAPDLPPRVALYRTFLTIVNSIALNTQKSEQDDRGIPLSKRPSAMEILAPKARQAFLLVAVEEFPPMTRPRSWAQRREMQGLIDEAGREIAKQMATDCRHYPGRAPDCAGPRTAGDRPRSPGGQDSANRRTSGGCGEAAQAGPGAGRHPPCRRQLRAGRGQRDPAHVLSAGHLRDGLPTAAAYRHAPGTETPDHQAVPPRQRQSRDQPALFFDIRGRPEQPSPATA